MNTNIFVEHPSHNVVIIKLNRPEKRNALNISLLQDFLSTLKSTEKDPSKRILILQGEGPVFCAGMDLAEACDTSKSIESSEILAQVFSALYHTPLITIAAVHGAAIAGGAGLVTACDLALASENTFFGYPETRRGLVAAQVMVFLMRQLKQKDLKELLLTGELIDAKKAQVIGLINQVVPQEKLLFEALKMANSVINGAPEATQETKQLIQKLYPSKFEEDLLLALSNHQQRRRSKEAQEGMQAFLEKRNPQWEI